MQIIVKNYRGLFRHNGKTTDAVAMEVDEEDMIFELKARVKAKFGIRWDNLCLQVFPGGRAFEDMATFVQEGIQREQTIFLHCS